MPRPRLLLFLIASVAIIGAGRTGPIAADEADAAETRARVEALSERIGAVQKRLAAERQRRDRASDELARIERRIGDIAGRLDELDRRMAATRSRLVRLGARREELTGELAAHRETLAGQLRAAYRLGRRPGLRLLLGQDDPAAASRALGYYAYLNEARVGAMERATGLLDDLEEVSKQTRAAQERLAADRESVAASRDELDRERAVREDLLARLDESIAGGDARLAELERRRGRLESLLEELGSVLGDTSASPLAEDPFSSRTGELPWPAKGPLRTRFGASRADGRMQWQGMVIAAEAGEPVRAVHHGRVVFADWLSGFGQLIIVDHQDGHMTLYGFNERLLRSNGDWVSPGEPIATVGDSGGRDRPGLYFEIRRGGKPVDPGPWLAAR